jgi:hypothetical protein
MAQNGSLLWMFWDNLLLPFSYFTLVPKCRYETITLCGIKFQKSTDPICYSSVRFGVMVKLISNIYSLQCFSNILFSFVLQIPLSILSKFMEKRYGPRWGNIVVWASLILGQPLCIMMYYHDYVIMQVGEDLLDRYGHV